MGFFDRISKLFQQRQREEAVLVPSGRPTRTLKTHKRRRKAGTWKYRNMVSGVNVPLRRVLRPKSANFDIDTRPRDDGHPNCPECGHNRFKTMYKYTAEGLRQIACRHCGDERLVKV